MSVSGGGAGGDDGDSDTGGLVGQFASFEGGDSFLTMPSINLRLVDLLTAIVGGLLFAFFEVVIRLVRLPLRVATAAFTALSTFLTGLVEALFGATGAIEVAFLAARADVIGTGLAGLVLAAGAALGASYVANWVIARVAE